MSSYGVTTEDAKVGDVPVVWITPKAWRDDGRILIYVHGGGFVAFSAHSTLYQSALMAARSGIKVLAVDYTTAPAARWPQITDQMIAVYRAVLAPATSQAKSASGETPPAARSSPAPP